MTLAIRPRTIPAGLRPFVVLAVPPCHWYYAPGLTASTVFAYAVAVSAEVWSGECSR
ncbi:hypothetical protein [Amycolatopsis sp. cmx-4-54]|uniref:hypothetical protein n=1 Tax=Amycolatopsis sp. cmx-4-54 TaxID=2790936 RepID=UPI00397E502A